MAENETVSAQSKATGKADDIAQTADAPTGNAPQGKRKNNRRTITIGVVGVVIVLAAAFWIWHEQPGFCNAVCHVPMDHYVETFNGDDKGMLAVVHREQGKNCLSCHEAHIDEQATEAIKWTTDNFPMDESGKVLASGKNFASEEFCTRSGCHNMDDVIANTWGFDGNDQKYNPHSSHQDLALDCGDCHKAHSTSVLMCNQCHSLNMPEGWEAPNAA